MICALTPFWALKAFRPVQSILDVFAKLNVSVFKCEIASLRESPNAKGLKHFFHGLMSAPKEKQRQAVEQAAAQAAVSRDSDPIFQWIVKLNEKYPGDIGVLCAATLNIVHLRPGQALYLGAGELHAYLEGLGVEIMANSDNVLRGGLTRKHIDVGELLKALTFESEVPKIIEPDGGRPGEKIYRTPAGDFELAFLEPTDEAPFESNTGRSVEILLCVEGQAAINGSDKSSLAIQKGGVVLIPASMEKYTIHGSAKIYRATVPSPE